MRVIPFQVECILIEGVKRRPGLGELDPIRVYLRAIPHPTYSQGEVIVTCYDRAWKTYFGNMGQESLAEFITTSDAGYLANRLLASAPRDEDGDDGPHEEYVTDIVKAVQAGLKQHIEDMGRMTLTARPQPNVWRYFPGIDIDAAHHQTA